MELSLKSKLFANIIVILSLSLTPIAHASVSTGDSLDLKPQTHLKTIETKHFEIQVPVPLMTHADTVSSYLEEAFQRLSKFFYWKPNHKIYVYLTDNTDLANGVTLFPFRRGLILYLTPPDSWMTTTFYDDWLWILIVHELAHYLNVDPTEGVSEVLRIIFGDIVRFNATLPDWMLEGLAVYLETKFTRGGRGRSSYYRMLSRAAVDANVFNTSDFAKLDQITSANTYFPAGQNPYFFGYQLMKEVATDPVNRKRKITYDKKNKIKNGDDLLGIMSIRSATRAPFFINHHLNKLTNKSWGDYWDQWIKARTISARKELKQIQSLGESLPGLLTKNGDFTLGNAISSDGKWIAYNELTVDEIAGLYIKNLKTGISQRITDKKQGVGLSFDPTSRYLFFSEITRHRQYNQYYDLNVYDLKTGKILRLTRGYRAQDPHVSPVGDQITFVQRKNGGTQLVVAQLKISKKGKIKLLNPKILFKPQGQYDSISNPKFSADGDQIFFCFHKNGKAQKDILSVSLPTKKITIWVRNGFMNRFPIHGKDRKLYFVSDQTGIDNLYRVSRPGARSKQMTNVKTGIWLPTFGNNTKQVYASYFTHKGWDLAKIPLNKTGYRKFKISPQPKIAYAKPVTPQVKTAENIYNYSPLSSFLPRDWRPTFSFSFVRPILGFQVGGFDSAYRSEYSLSGAYDFLTKKPDGEVLFSTRKLGPTLTFGGTYYTPSSSIIVDSSGTLRLYTRRPQVRISLSYPFKYQYSSLSTSLSFSVQRDFYFSGSDTTPYDVSPAIPVVSTSLVYSRALNSALGVTIEQGPYAILSGAAYLLPEAVNWKILARYIDYWRVSKHAVLVPSITGSWVNRESTEYISANVVFSGDLGGTLSLDSFRSQQSLSEIFIRGYPLLTLSRKTAAVASMDFRFPLIRIYRGMGTAPYFFKDLIAFVYGEAGILPGRTFNGTSLFPSAGGGLKLSTQIFNLPMTFGGEIQQGFNSAVGGATQFVMSFRLNATNF